MAFLKCDSELTLDAMGQPQCSQWSIVEDDQVLGGVEILQYILSTLSSINDFDPATAAKLVGGYCVIFIVGYGAGTVTRLMKKV